MSNVFEATYRKATADDFEFMYSLWRCNQRFGMSIPRKGRITEWLDRGEANIITITSEGEVIRVGMFVTHKRKIPCELKGAVELKCFCVDDSFKGKGIGTSILKSILDTNPFVILDCKKGSRNESFYTKNGLSVYGEKHVGNTDVLLMKKISDKVKTLF